MICPQTFFSYGQSSSEEQLGFERLARIRIDDRQIIRCISHTQIVQAVFFSLFECSSQQTLGIG
jgi:hypothetical protein